jgi:hypothetical protein
MRYGTVRVPPHQCGDEKSVEWGLAAAAHSSLYIESLQGWYSSPNWFDRQPGV